MNKMNWIKMGSVLAKLVVLVIFAIIANKSTSNGVVSKHENFNFNKILGMSASASKKEEEKPKPVEKKVVVETNRLTGDLTGYAADCALCNGTLACMPKYNVYKNNVVTYNDSKYGNVRIVASSTKMPCGSIVRFNWRGESTTAIVLDRGVLGNDLDLLMANEDEAIRLVGRKRITYEVLRRGW